jgi:hypothetical protein
MVWAASSPRQSVISGRQRQHQHQHRLMGHVPHLAGLPLPAAGLPVAEQGLDCRPSPILTHQIPGGRQITHQQERFWTADPPVGHHADGAPALLLDGAVASRPHRRVPLACGAQARPAGLHPQADRTDGADRCWRRRARQILPAVSRHQVRDGAGRPKPSVGPRRHGPGGGSRPAGSGAPPSASTGLRHRSDRPADAGLQGGPEHHRPTARARAGDATAPPPSRAGAPRQRGGPLAGRLSPDPLLLVTQPLPPAWRISRARTSAPRPPTRGLVPRLRRRSRRGDGRPARCGTWPSSRCWCLVLALATRRSTTLSRPAGRPDHPESAASRCAGGGVPGNARRQPVSLGAATGSGSGSGQDAPPCHAPGSLAPLRCAKVGRTESMAVRPTRRHPGVPHRPGRQA